MEQTIPGAAVDRSRAAASLVAAREAASDYRPRAAEATVVHRVVRDHLETFLERAAARSGGAGLPAFVERQLRSVIRCGVLAAGFARFRCPACEHERLVPLSCKSRGACPSCDGRRMAERAAHLADSVLPTIPMRQWVLTLPHRLRYLLAWDHPLCCAVFGVFVRAIEAFQRERARREGIEGGRGGAVTVIQRFASGLRLNVHGHTLVPDGVFHEDDTGALCFHELPPPTDAEIARLVTVIRRRVLRLLTRRGLGDPSSRAGDTAAGIDIEVDIDVAADVDPVQDAEPALAPLLGASVRGTVAFGPNAGAPVARVGRDPRSTWQAWVDSRAPLQASQGGFDLHAAVSVGAEDRPGLERVSRYLLRPAIAQERLSLLADGRVQVELDRPWHDGTSHLVFDPLDFLARLAAFVPKPRANLILYYGVFAGNARWRRRVVAFGRADEAADPTCTEPCECTSSGPGDDPSVPAPKPPAPRARPNYTWAELMERSFHFEVRACPMCRTSMALVALIVSPALARPILERRGLSTALPKFRPARSPPSYGWS